MSAIEMNVQRQARRHVYAPPHGAVIDVPPGFAAEVEEEIRSILDTRLAPSRLNPIIRRRHGHIELARIDYRERAE